MIAVWLMWEGRRCRPCSHTRLVLERRGRNFSLLRHRLFRSSLWSTYHSIESTDRLFLGWALIIFRRVFYQISKLFVAFWALFFRHGSWLVVQLGDLHRSQFWISCRMWQFVVRDCMLQTWISFCSNLVVIKWWRWILTCAKQPERWLATTWVMLQYLVSASLILHLWCLTI